MDSNTIKPPVTLFARLRRRVPIDCANRLLPVASPRSGGRGPNASSPLLVRLGSRDFRLVCPRSFACRRLAVSLLLSTLSISPLSTLTRNALSLFARLLTTQCGRLHGPARPPSNLLSHPPRSGIAKGSHERRHRETEKQNLLTNDTLDSAEETRERDHDLSLTSSRHDTASPSSYPPASSRTIRGHEDRRRPDRRGRHARGPICRGGVPRLEAPTNVSCVLPESGNDAGSFPL